MTLALSTSSMLTLSALSTPEPVLAVMLGRNVPKSPQSTLFPSWNAAELRNFIFIKHLYYLTIDRLSGKMTIFAHGYNYLSKNKDNQKG